MTKNKEDLGGLQKTNLEAAVRLARLSIDNSQRVMEIQVNAAKRLFQDGLENAKALSAATDPLDAIELRAKFAQNTTEQMLACTRQFAEISTSIQEELGRLVGEQLHTGNNDVYDALQRMLSSSTLVDPNSLEAMQTALDMVRSAFEEVARASNDAFSALTQQSSQGTR